MRLFALADLHLPGSTDKVMDVFGAHWKDHHLRIFESWTDAVGEDDTVLLPGDLSWAMTLEEALPDLRWTGELPGRKLLLKGNHDYWWTSLAKMKAVLPESMIPLQNSAVDLGFCTVAGSRGWRTPESPEYSEDEDGRIYLREMHRLRLSLEEASRIHSDGPLVVMMHYPPVVDGAGTAFAELISAAGADICVYGHLHSAPGDWPEELDTQLDGVTYRLVSADRLGFEPLLILEQDGHP